MAARRTRNINGADVRRSTPARASGIAEQLHYECSTLLELFRKRESFPEDVADGRLVSIPPPSSQLDARDKLWCIHSALLQCQNLLEKATAKEEEELGGGRKGEYENQRKMVKERLSLLILCIGELLKAADGTAVLTPSLEGLELNIPVNLFELKVWVYRIFKEVDYWSKTTITALKDLPSVTVKEGVRTTRARDRRSTRR
uniref:Ciliary neurotrophic factor n=1 Tax=Amphilophus citrinellus TaxID=61819 RepID=A0A3Q0RZ06_AMPCI